MIAKIALFLVGAALTVSAQTNFDVLVCKNASYTNATIIRATLAYLVVTHNDGIAKVALTNLPNSLQQKYKYDPDKATAALAAEEKHRLDDIKARMEQVKYIASLRGTNRVIRVKAVLGLGVCQTSVGQICITGLPLDVGNFFYRRADLQAALTELKNTPAVGAPVYGVYDYQFELDNARADALHEAQKLRKEKLEQLQDDLNSLNHTESQETTIIAFPTGTMYAGIPLWKCVGIAP
jgi:hypothetical protein